MMAEVRRAQVDCDDCAAGGRPAVGGCVISDGHPRRPVVSFVMKDGVIHKH